MAQAQPPRCPVVPDRPGGCARRALARPPPVPDLAPLVALAVRTRVVQRIAYTEIGKKLVRPRQERPYARLVNSYMAKKLEEADDEHQAAVAAQGARHDDDVEQAPSQVRNGRDLLKSCSYDGRREAGAAANRRRL